MGFMHIGHKSETKYYHSDDSKRVHAKLINAPSVYDELDKYNNGEHGSLYPILSAIRIFAPKVYRKIRNNIDNSAIYKAYAECDEKDTFDLEKGKKIASLKADLKYHDRMDKDYAVIIEGLEQALSVIREMKAKHVNCYNRIFDRLVEDYSWKEDIE